jgi:hypothetical protein
MISSSKRPSVSSSEKMDPESASITGAKTALSSA